MKLLLTAAFLLSFAALPTNLAAQTVLVEMGDGVIRDNLCLGDDCGDTFDLFEQASSALILTDTRVRIDFEDTSEPSTTFPSRDWSIFTNDFGSNGQEYFAIEDRTATTTPFRIIGGAPDDALYVAADGKIGLGTTVPTQTLHMIDSVASGLRMQTTTDTADWVMNVGNSGLVIFDFNGGPSAPFAIENGAPSDALRISDDGNVGMGIETAAAPLHVRNVAQAASETSGILVENANVTKAARGLLQLRNNGQVYFGLEDTSIIEGADSGRIWNFQNRNGIFRVTTAPGGPGEVEMELDIDGNMTIEGNYFAASGTQLNVPDYVFSPDYDLKPLREVEAFITEHNHLPGVPSAAEINAQGLNMTDMQMRLLQKVEELTLHSIAQHKQIEAQAQALSRLTHVEAELAQVRALLAQP